MSAEVKGLHEYQKKNRASSSEDRGKRKDVRRKTFTIEEMLQGLARGAVDRLFDNIMRGGR